MNTSIVIEKLREYMATHHLSARQLADKLGWTAGDLGAILGGHKTVGKNRLLHISRTLGISFEFTIGALPGEPVPPPLPGEIPVISLAKGGANGFFDEQGYPVGEGFRKVKRPYDLTDPKAYGVEVRGDSMAPRYDERDVVIASPRKAVASGDYVVAKTKSGEVMVKRIRFSNDVIILESVNQAYAPIIMKREDVLFYHKIVWVKPRG